MSDWMGPEGMARMQQQAVSGNRVAAVVVVAVVFVIATLIGFVTKSFVAAIVSGSIILFGCVAVAIFWSVGTEVDNY
jgi:uncharacterized membrane protein YphA (DoxX/SURF4 family)